MVIHIVQVEAGFILYQKLPYKNMRKQDFQDAGGNIKLKIHYS